MAVGDVVSDVTNNVASGAFMTYQPAAGVLAIITAYGSGLISNGIPQPEMSLYDGTDEAIIGHPTLSTEKSGFRIFINNSVYVRFKNADGTARDVGFSGLQIG